MQCLRGQPRASGSHGPPECANPGATSTPRSLHRSAVARGPAATLVPGTPAASSGADPVPMAPRCMPVVLLAPGRRKPVIDLRNDADRSASLAIACEVALVESADCALISRSTCMLARSSAPPWTGCARWPKYSAPGLRSDSTPARSPAARHRHSPAKAPADIGGKPRPMIPLRPVDRSESRTQYSRSACGNGGASAMLTVGYHRRNRAIPWPPRPIESITERQDVGLLGDIYSIPGSDDAVDPPAELPTPGA